jgi:hypothetical protein
MISLTLGVTKRQTVLTETIDSSSAKCPCLLINDDVGLLRMTAYNTLDPHLDLALMPIGPLVALIDANVPLAVPVVTSAASFKPDVLISRRSLSLSEMFGSCGFLNKTLVPKNHKLIESFESLKLGCPITGVFGGLLVLCPEIFVFLCIQDHRVPCNKNRGILTSHCLAVNGGFNKVIKRKRGFGGMKNDSCFSRSLAVVKRLGI